MESACPVTGWNLQEAFEALIPDHLKTELQAVKKALADARTKDLLTPGILDGGNLEEKAAAREWLKRMEAALISTERGIENYLEEQLNSAVCHAKGRIGSIMADGTDFAPYSWANIRLFFRGHTEGMIPCAAMIVEADKQTPVYDLRIFDAPPGAAEARTWSSQKAATLCFQWLCGLMAASPRKKPMNKSAFRKEALGKFKDLSKTSFDVQWDRARDATPGCTWGSAGRLPESCHENQEASLIEPPIPILTPSPS